MNLVPILLAWLVQKSSLPDIDVLRKTSTKRDKNSVKDLCGGGGLHNVCIWMCTFGCVTFVSAYIYMYTNLYNVVKHLHWIHPCSIALVNYLTGRGGLHTMTSSKVEREWDMEANVSDSGKQ